MKNKLVYLLILLGLFLTNRSSAQISDSNNVASVFKVQGFSDRYEAKVYLKDPQAVFSAGWVAVYDKKSEKELLKIASEDLAVDFVDDEVEANVHERPYGKQNVLIYEDFNFDGQKDLAISDGNHSCYGGPSYQIYLADGDGFSFSKSFTKLAQDYCGLFAVNEEDQTLSTMTKSGCCWHQFSTFKVKDNTPYLIKRKEIDAQGNNPIGVEEKTDYKRVNGKMESTSTKIINEWELKVDGKEFRKDYAIAVYTFKNGKKMYLVKQRGDQYLYYAFVNKNNEIELLYTGNFKENLKEYCVQFTNKGITYKIFSDRLEIILSGGKVVTMKPVKKHNGVGIFLG